MRTARKQYPFRLSDDDVRFLDELAKHYGNRSEAMRASIRIAIDALRKHQAELSTKKQAELSETTASGVNLP